MIQKHKYERFWQTINGRDTENGLALDEKIAELERMDHERDLLIQSRIDEKRGKVSQALSKVEENRYKTKIVQKENMKKIVHEFVAKQKHAEVNREKSMKEKHDLMEKYLKKHRDNIKKAIEAKKEHEKKVAQKIKLEKNKAKVKLAKMRESQMANFEKNKLKSIAFEEHRHQVLEAHAAIIDEFVIFSHSARRRRGIIDEYPRTSSDD